MSLSASELLKFNKRKVVQMTLPEFGNKPISIRLMNGAEREAYEMAMYSRQQENKDVSLSVLAAVFCVSDEDGKALFSIDQYDEVMKLPGSALVRIFDEADQLNLLTGARIEAAKKTLKPADSKGSGSASQKTSTRRSKNSTHA